jgi:hypothetical protein
MTLTPIRVMMFTTTSGVTDELLEQLSVIDHTAHQLTGLFILIIAQ